MTRIDPTVPSLTLPANDFSAVVTADYFTGGVGFFFYRQRPVAGVGDPCMTTFSVMVSTNRGDTFTAPMPVSAPFRSARTSFASSLGHYVEAADFNEPGVLLATWSQPVVITSGETCFPCQGDELSVATFAARVRP